MVYKSIIKQFTEKFNSFYRHLRLFAFAYRFILISQKYYEITKLSNPVSLSTTGSSVLKYYKITKLSNCVTVSLPLLVVLKYYKIIDFIVLREIYRRKIFPQIARFGFDETLKKSRSSLSAGSTVVTGAQNFAVTIKPQS